MIREWHKPDEEVVPPVYINVEALFRVDHEGGLSIRLLDRKGMIFGVGLSGSEADRLAELLWTGRE